MGRKMVYFCDICNKEFTDENSVRSVDLGATSWDGDFGLVGHDICDNCYECYKTEMVRVTRVLKDRKKY